MLILAENMQTYFRQALLEAIEKSSTHFSEEIQTYLTYLLTDFARSDRVYAGFNSGEEPILVLLLERALEADPNEANRIFKQIGDSTLYLLGFFGEKTKAQGVSNSYYISMGENAYFSLAKNTRQPIYHELSDAFERLVFLLRQVSLHDKEVTSEQILSWFEEYQVSKNPQLKALLLRHGVSLQSADPHLLVS